MAKKKESTSASTILALGAGAVALAASSYYFFGPKGKTNRHKAAGWMIKMKGEIIEKLEDAGEITEAAYHNIVDSVLASYATAGKIAEPELKMFADNLKGQWKNILATLKAHQGGGKKKSAGKGKMRVAKVVKKAKKAGKR